MWPPSTAVTDSAEPLKETIFSRLGAGIDLVFHAEGQAVQRSAPASRSDLALGFTRGRERRIRAHRDIGAQDRVPALNAREAGLHKFGG